MTQRSSWSTGSKRSLALLSQLLHNTRPYRRSSGLSSELDNTNLSTRTSQRLGMPFSRFTVGSNDSIISLSYTKFEQSGRKLAQENDAARIPVEISPESLYNPWWYAVPSLESQINIQESPTSKIVQSLCAVIKEATFRGDTAVLAAEPSRAHMDTSYSLFLFCLETAISNSDTTVVSWLLSWMMERDKGTGYAMASATLDRALSTKKDQVAIYLFKWIMKEDRVSLMGLFEVTLPKVIGHGDTTLIIKLFDAIKITLGLEDMVTTEMIRLALVTTVDKKELDMVIQLLNWIKRELHDLKQISLYALAFRRGLRMKHVSVALTLLNWGFEYKWVPFFELQEEGLNTAGSGGDVDMVVSLLEWGIWAGRTKAETQILARICFESVVLNGHIATAVGVMDWILRDDSEEALDMAVKLLDSVRVKSMALDLYPKVFKASLSRNDLTTATRILDWMMEDPRLWRHYLCNEHSRGVALNASRPVMAEVLDLMAEKDMVEAVRLYTKLLDSSLWQNNRSTPIRLLYWMMRSDQIRDFALSNDGLISQLNSQQDTMIEMLDWMQTSLSGMPPSLLPKLSHIAVSNSYLTMAVRLLDWIQKRNGVTGAHDLHISSLTTAVENGDVAVAVGLLKWNQGSKSRKQKVTLCQPFLEIALHKCSRPMVVAILDWMGASDMVRAVVLQKSAIQTAVSLKASGVVTGLLEWIEQNDPEESNRQYGTVLEAALQADAVEMAIELLGWVFQKDKDKALSLYSRSVQSTLSNPQSAMHLALQSWDAIKP
ncbi:hypothetical protein P167DRAFT_540600 [Morchella conica CCBAS932]|uniref:Uncharacterized protein n=1 Tax=Morchella conica CCBAS932 TaxID=1392247 RepID=A0A3N4K8K4_9PEZI|nr:hypothetical protein P167DRAFT_540600 [Morchella conica CCBAS932]